MKSNPDSVTVVGLGMLGSALASAFLAHGHPTVVWNRSADKADPLIERGAVRGDTLAAAVATSDVVVVCVSTYDAVRQLLTPASDALGGRVLVNLSSGTPTQAREMATWATERGAEYIDGAAMSGTRLVGRPEALFLYSGSPRAFAAHRELLASLGTARDLGEDPALASLHDTALFGAAWGALTGFYHATALLEAQGVDPTRFAPILTGHLPFIAGLIEEHARQIRLGSFPNDDGTVEVHAAAMEHLVHTSRDLGIRTDFPELVTAMLERAAGAGHGDQGIASAIEVIRKS